MAEQFDNTNSGALFKNKFKEKEKHPDYKGEINVEGKELEIAAWIKTSKAGNKYFSLEVSEPYGDRQQTDKSEKSGFRPISSSLEEVVEVKIDGKDEDSAVDEDIPF